MTNDLGFAFDEGAMTLLSCARSARHRGRASGQVMRRQTRSVVICHRFERQTVSARHRHAQRRAFAPQGADPVAPGAAHHRHLFQRHVVQPQAAAHLDEAGVDAGPGGVGTLQAGTEADVVVLNPQATPLLARKTARAQNLEELLFSLIVLGDERVVERVLTA